ncbi:MAG: dTDP-glucose 4,6-dehydratase, partial [Dehalobacterium sp.]
MKILVTGGAGFIGVNFIYYMLEHHPDYEITCLDSLTYAGNIHSLDSAISTSSFKFIRGDVTDRALVFNLFESEIFDIVINFAAESHVDRSIEDPSVFLRTNILGTANLLDASRQYQVGRFHQISTDEVYGELPLDRPELLFTEQSPIKTSSPYSASKASADLLVQSYFKTFHLPVTISRCSNNYGPFQFPEKLIPLMITRSLENNSLPVYGRGINVRDWLHVYDHCHAIDSILQKGKEGEVYNIGGNNEKTNLDVVKT